MSGGISSSSVYSHRVPSKNKTQGCCTSLLSSWRSSSSSPSLIPSSSRTVVVLLPRRRISLRCNSTTGPGGPGDNENRTVLDAFFLGKALAEALNERIESTVGEFLSTVGRLQAEQQKQVLDFQEEVLERAKKAKEKAAREAMEVQGLVPKSSSSTGNISTVINGVTSTVSSAADDAPVNSPSPPTSGVVNGDNDQNPIDTDPFSEGI
ncbi:hypothetical protein LguiA_011700 [Lonicera macranthoides]